MAIASLADLVAASKQVIGFNKTGTTVNGPMVSYFDLASVPAAGTLAGTSTTTGTVPTDATAGCPTINNFGGLTGYIAGFEGFPSSILRVSLYDMLWKGGAYAFNASVTGQSPTSYSSRLPETDYNLCEIWAQQVTAATGTQNINVEYTNEGGTTGRTSGAQSMPATTIRTMLRIPLQAGDRGVQGITGVTGTTASAGTFNLLVMRRVMECYLFPGETDFIKMLLPQIYEDSALMPAVRCAGGSSSFEGEWIIAVG